VRQVVRRQGGPKGVALVQELLLVEIRKGGAAVVANDGKDLEVVLVCEGREPLGYVKGVDVIGDELRHVVAHAGILQYGYYARSEKRDGNGAEAEGELLAHRQLELTYLLSQ